MVGYSSTKSPKASTTRDKTFPANAANSDLKLNALAQFYVNEYYLNCDVNFCAENMTKNQQSLQRINTHKNAYESSLRGKNGSSGSVNDLIPAWRGIRKIAIICVLSGITKAKAMVKLN